MHIGLDAPDPKGHYTHSAAGRNQSPVSAVAVAWPKPKPRSKLIFNSFGAKTVAVAEIRVKPGKFVGHSRGIMNSVVSLLAKTAVFNDVTMTSSLRSVVKVLMGHFTISQSSK